MSLVLEDAGMRGSSRLFRVKEDFTFNGITVPAGFLTDGASIPRIFWNVLSPFGRYFPAALVHDYLYASGTVSRAQADSLFLEGMAILGVPWITRRAIYRAVRLFGWRFYKG